MIVSTTFMQLPFQFATQPAKGRVTAWAYDANGRPISRTLPLGQSESYSYDAIGNRVSNTDFNGNTHTFTYDTQNDWLIEEQWADGQNINYNYNAIGQRLSANDSQGNHTYEHDVLDRLTLETKPNGNAISYGYDANGNRTTLTTTVDGIVSTTDYTFDALDRMLSATDADNRTTSYTYDDNGNQTGIAQANGTSTSTVFDALNRITNITHSGTDSAVLLSLDYTLDPTGRLVRITESTGRESSYTYDTLYRLTSDNIIDPINGNHYAGYEYDEVGNRIYTTINGVQTQYTVDNNDRLIQQGGTGIPPVWWTPQIER